MRYAFVSDIHSNWQAWTAVLADIRQQNVDSIICLGDIIGYGPRPVEVLESVYQECSHVVMGNHDAVIGGILDADLFNDNARSIIEWTKERLNDHAQAYFADLPIVIDGDLFSIAHSEFAVPERFGYINTAEDACESFDVSPADLMFVGHTHKPGVFINNDVTGEISGFDGRSFQQEAQKRYICNVGRTVPM
ncbi:hypothetical protein BVY04_05265 [bacterium M21]|nr:hypothetical protein BVY04_05265 [bacterium M21]